MDERRSYVLAYGILAIAIIALIIFLLFGMKSVRAPGASQTGATSTSEGGNIKLTQTYTSANFLLQYPAGYIVDKDYHYQLDQNKKIKGVKFTIPASMANGTNLAPDTHVSIEWLPDAQCSASLFLFDVPKPQTINDSGVIYSLASSTGAAAGNRYEEIVYALPETACYAVRYFIHYGVIENYPLNAVKEFDRAGLLRQFDAIRRSFFLLARGYE